MRMLSFLFLLLALACSAEANDPFNFPRTIYTPIQFPGGWPDALTGHITGPQLMSLGANGFDVSAEWGAGELDGYDGCYFQRLHHHAYFLAYGTPDLLRAIVHIDTHDDYDLGTYELRAGLFEQIAPAAGGMFAAPEPGALLLLAMVLALAGRRKV